MGWMMHVIMFVRTNLKFIALAAGVIIVIFVAVYGSIYLKEYRTKQAAEALYKARDLPEGSTEQLEALADVADKYASTGSGHLAMLIRGETFFTKGEYEAAASEFGVLAKKSKSQPFMHVTALHAMARSFFAAGKIEDAAKAYLQAASVPHNLNKDESLYQAARCYEELENIEEAKKLHQKVRDTSTNETAKSRAEERLLWLMAGESETN